MHKLNEIDGLEIFVLMDNVSDPFTKNNQGIYWNESQYRYGVRKQQEICGSDYCRACNGLSFFIRIKIDDKTHTLLFDTGPDAGLAVENANRLGLNLNEVEAIVLSHGHFDHYGGTISVLNAIGKKNLPVYIHPELFLPRAFGEKELIYVSYNLTAQQIEKNGGKIIESSKPITFLDDCALISGEVPRITSYEKGFPDEHRLKDMSWQCSPEVIDERCLMFYVKNKGICVITGCGHTGIINATEHAISSLKTDKVYCIIGGFHLAGSEFSNRINATITDLQRINPDYVITGHCTGRQTQETLSKAFSHRHIPYGVGSVFRL